MYECYKQIINKLSTDGIYKEIDHHGKIINKRFRIYEPAGNMEITALTKSWKWLPPNYLEFLTISNGCSLYEDIKYGGENTIFSTEELLRYNESGSALIKVAYIYDDLVFINLNDADQGKPYIYINESTSPWEYSRFLDLTFESWLEKFLNASCNKFWI